jgi:predicted transcriptional regulator
MFVPQSLNERLEALARAEQRSKSQVISRLLETALQARVRKM